MNRKRILGILLVLVLTLSLLNPVSLVAGASETLVTATEPVIGESYYLGADVDGTMMYFCTYLVQFFYKFCSCLYYFHSVRYKFCIPYL